MILLAAIDQSRLLTISSAFVRMAENLLTLSVIVVTAYAMQDDAMAMHTVVGCLSRDGASWTLTQATVGEPTDQAFTTREGLQASTFLELGTLTYRLLGVAQFTVEEHEGHKMQVKGLHLSIDNDLRLIERLKRVGPSRIDCQMALIGPKAYTRPWTVVLPMTKAESSIF